MGAGVGCYPPRKSFSAFSNSGVASVSAAVRAGVGGMRLRHRAETAIGRERGGIAGWMAAVVGRSDRKWSFVKGRFSRFASWRGEMRLRHRTELRFVRKRAYGAEIVVTLNGMLRLRRKWRLFAAVFDER